MVLFGMWSDSHLYHGIIISMQSGHYLCCHRPCHTSLKHGAVFRGLKYMITSFEIDAMVGEQAAAH